MKQWNREQQYFVNHQIPNAEVLTWIYNTKVGRLLGRLLFARRFFGRLNGWYYDQPRSQSKIEPFIQQYQIAMKEFETVEYTSFNDFFVRRFKPDIRPFVDAPERLPAFAEARLLAWLAVEDDQSIPVKGQCLKRKALLQDDQLAERFDGGPVIVARLAPQDYHRFHFADTGEVVAHYQCPGPLHSVSPIALKQRADVWCTNYRHVTVQTTANFGQVVYIDVGAMTIGRIVQLMDVGAVPKRGDERGYFMYGGSTVILLGEPGAWRPDDDIIENTAQGIETIVKLGIAIATAVD